LSFGRCCRFRRLFFSGLRHDEGKFSANPSNPPKHLSKK
jgi:hypothetical protein